MEKKIARLICEFGVFMVDNLMFLKIGKIGILKIRDLGFAASNERFLVDGR